ncbi:sterol 3-beta-glucosyltransferase [Elsinoe australis]|uniref:Sterol 3-beta-glucosyltransferase n=1 Tax=Elsinoe australis TaxID=40998 RepID=A0A4U7AY78_9PEZI|nr:sterol 3-beta-glucosyltransferase [Elsinoe australis]
MATRNTSQHRRASRQLSRRKRDPGMIKLPDRFKTDDDDEAQEEVDMERGGMPFMHQSVFGVIAAAQSKEDFKSILDEEVSEESGDESSGTVSEPKRPSYGSQVDPAGPSRPKQKKKLSDHKLLRSLPGLRSRHAKDKDERGRKASSPLSSPPMEENTFRDAPVMSQMLQARANAADSLESSNATLTNKASASTTSLRSSRKAPVALPEALKDIFQFDQSEEVISEYPCWYLANVLLQGYMYITQRHVCFYAYLQQKSNTTIKSGYLAKRGKTNPHYRRYWFTLKGTVFSYFTDPSTPYFPSGNIDLRYGISADLEKEKEKDRTKETTFFSVTTDKRTYHFKADSVPSAKEWVKQLQKVIFRSHNDGDSVKISLPIDNILDIEENPVIDFAETIKIRVIDNDETYAVDEYFFSFFSFGKDALNVLKIMTQDTMAAKALLEQTGKEASQPGSGVTSPKIDGEGRPSMNLTVPEIYENVRATIPVADGPRRSMDIIRSGRSSIDGGRRSIDRPRASFDRQQRSVSAASRVSFNKPQARAKSPMPGAFDHSPDSSVTADDSAPQSIMNESTDQSESDPSGSRILSGSGVFRDPTLAASASRRQPESPRLRPSGEFMRSVASSRSASNERRIEKSPLSPKTPSDDFTKPSSAQQIHKAASAPTAEPRQSGSYTESLGGLMRAGAYPIRQATDLAGMLRDQGRRMSSIPRGYYEKVYGMWAGGKRHYADADGLKSEDYVHDPDEESDTAQAEARFRDYFALPESEKLVASYFAHIMRVLPLYGKIYIGSTKLCFRSLLPGTRTKLIIPFKDILNVDKEKGFRFGYSGMVVVIRGHEEIFFEFNTAGLRDDCTVTILKSFDTMKQRVEHVTITEEEQAEAEQAAQENLRLQEARADGYADHDIMLPRDIDEIDHGAPTILFDDPQASLLDFKPSEPLAITCLTIGSRGDVQPYIALCKGLLAEGHKAKIATHAEFEPWIRKHGIDFAPVEGDPAELMRICVDNGMFTPSFIYEANAKMRGFLDTLLTTAWTACQGSDVLIESPSAMAGIHIAEALGIPYFRAFTMPWTRTRAYPHAFAVPNHKMGGAYNYMTYVLFDNLFWQSTAGQINRWRRKVLRLRPTTLDRLQPNKVPFLYNFSPSVVVPPLDFSDWIRVTGYWFLDEATSWVPPPPLLAFINKARSDGVPLVYIGFGSVVVSDSRALTKAIVKAVEKADVRCILSKGWSDRLDDAAKTVPEIPLPDCIMAISSAPHDWLFAQIDAAVHHGGAGTTGASLRAGVPTIIKPFFGDQFFFGARVHDLGVGVCIRKVSEQVLGKALWIATHDARMREKARVLGEQIRSEDGVGNAIKAVYRDLEYAKTLVKRRGRRVEEGQSEEEDLEVEAEGQSESWTFVEGDSGEEVGGKVGKGMGREAVGSPRAG